MVIDYGVVLVSRIALRTCHRCLFTRTITWSSLHYINFPKTSGPIWTVVVIGQSVAWMRA
jgi:hypothetical protein